MQPLYPLRFRPIFRQYLWGGERLKTLLHKPAPSEGPCAESWEICDHGVDQSIVEFGPLAGTTLGQLVHERGRDLLGRHHPQPQFPLLVKLLDAAQSLSVQVHPDDALAATLTPPDLGKTEAWVVLASEPGSVIYAGLKPGVDHNALEAAIRQGHCETCLHVIHPKPGNCVFVPAGTVHALGAGLLIAEIQQSSDVTYRLFDWNRKGPDGQPRPLHIDRGLDATDFDRGPIAIQPPRPTNRPEAARLVECEKFWLDRLTFSNPISIGGDGRCHILVVLKEKCKSKGTPPKRRYPVEEPRCSRLIWQAYNSRRPQRKNGWCCWRLICHNLVPCPHKRGHGKQ